MYYVVIRDLRIIYIIKCCQQFVFKEKVKLNRYFNLYHLILWFTFVY